MYTVKTLESNSVLCPKGSSPTPWKILMQRRHVLPRHSIQNPMKPEVAQLGVGSIPPSKAVGDIPSSTYTPSRAASMPYRNTGSEPARYINILSALQQFQAFFGFEAPALESECSPTVVFPLQTARADMSQLQTQSDVLERNPGIPSTISSKELAVMMSNLRFLQKAGAQIQGQLWNGTPRRQFL